MDEVEEDTTPLRHSVVKQEPAWSVEEGPQDQPSTVAQPMPDNTLGSLQSVNRSHVCQRCSAAFVLVSSLELHLASFHGDRLPYSESPELPDSPRLHCQGSKSIDVMNMVHGGLVTKMMDHADKELGDSAADFVVKLEPPWSMKEDSQDQPPAIHITRRSASAVDSPVQPLSPVDSPGQPLSDSASGSLLALSRSQVCQRSSAAFLLFNNLEQPTASSGRERLHTESPASPVPDSCDAGTCSSLAGEQSSTLGDKRDVERASSEVNNTDIERRGEEEKSMVHVCDMGNNTGYFKEHKSIQTSQTPLVCDMSSKAFARASDLKGDALIPTSPTPLVCDVCSGVFLTASYLKIHKLVHASRKRFLCDTCDQSFSSASNLKIHLRLHAGERPRIQSKKTPHIQGQKRPRSQTHKCSVCDLDFTASSELHKHIKSAHAGDRPHICEICGAAFSEFSNLKRHKRIHTGERPHTCDVCQAAFSRADDLKRHKTIHVCDKPLLCTDCGKGFARSSHLKRHRLIHTGEKPHSCPYCPAAFTQSGDLKRHVQRVHQ